MTAPITLGPLTKVSANFLPRSMVALEAAAELSGDNHTDCLNRAIQVYAYVEQLRVEGKELQVVDPETGVVERLEFS
jgi:hypothetical protein